MEARARSGREDAESQLLDLPADAIDSRFIHLYYTKEEGDEIY
jgi:hypothetical protein